MEQLLPLTLAYVGLGIMLAVSCIGSSIGVTIGGNATIGAMKKNPDIFGSSMILCALPSTSWPDLVVGENTFIMEDNTIMPFCQIGNNAFRT
jgi:F0F1-type ATP synthase membrane subunit c/vacuolar-type H+-ATPase subunit K